MIKNSKKNYYKNGLDKNTQIKKVKKDKGQVVI